MAIIRRCLRHDEGSIPFTLAKQWSDDGTGIRVGLRNQILRVRIPLRLPNLGGLVQRKNGGLLTHMSQVRLLHSPPILT